MVKQLVAIPEAEKTPRSNKRRAASVDQDCAKRARKLKAACNLDSSCIEGNQTTELSFLNFSNDHILLNMAAIGISLGNDSDKDNQMIEALKSIEKQRWVDTYMQEKVKKITKNRKRWTKKKKLINLCYNLFVVK
jgi:hypothetical protein